MSDLVCIYISLSSIVDKLQLMTFQYSGLVTVCSETI